jgi:hypothetical protein
MGAAASGSGYRQALIDGVNKVKASLSLCWAFLFGEGEKLLGDCARDR